MDNRLKVVAGVALTSLVLGIIGAVTVRRRIGVRGVGLVAAIPSAFAWAVPYGFWGWQHRADLEHIERIKNYPLTLHVIFVSIEAALYAALGFAVAVGVAKLFERVREKRVISPRP